MKKMFCYFVLGGPWAPFENSWHLREDYKKVAKRKELADALSKRILWVGLANLILSPVIFLWQILYSFFNYAEVRSTKLVIVSLLANVFLYVVLYSPIVFFFSDG